MKYLELMRLNKPIGIWLLLWPGWWAIALASSEPLQEWYIFLLFLIGSIVMRSAGCVINDILDAKIDAEVERTKSRPIASGEISKKFAFMLFLILCSVGLLILLQFNQVTIIIGCAAFLMVLIYPLMKRFNPCPQAFLGAVFNIGVLMGYAALTNNLSYQIWLLYIAAIFWTIGYDTIYAMQDAEYDMLLNVKSSALLFGNHAKLVVMICYSLFMLLLAFSIQHYIAFIACSVLWCWLIFKTYRLDLRDNTQCLKHFTMHGWLGFYVLLLVLVVAYLG